MHNIKCLILSVFLLCASLVSAEPVLIKNKNEISLSSGYTWKKDVEFKRIYGKGVHNVITIDATHYFHKYFGLGAQVAYWKAKGYTNGCNLSTYRDTDGYMVFKSHSPWSYRHRLHQIPVLVHLKARVGTQMQAYALIGGGMVYAKERLYKYKTSHVAPAFHAELGLKYHFCHCAFVKAAAYWINSHKHMSRHDNKLDFGGKGIRIGMGAAF